MTTVCLIDKRRHVVEMANGIDEEFNNFMHRVDEVAAIVRKLGSKEKLLQEMGSVEAERYLRRADGAETLDVEGVVLRVKSDRTVINREALLKEDGDRDEATMSRDAFMAEVSRDADKRYKDRLVRKEKMETFRKRAALAFRRGEYETALGCYNKAVEQIRDSCALYVDRCLTYVNLRLYDRAVGDAETALRLKPDSLKARLLLAKAHYLNGTGDEQFEGAVRVAKAAHPNRADFIAEFVAKLRAEGGREVGEKREGGRKQKDGREEEGGQQQEEVDRKQEDGGLEEE